MRGLEMGSESAGVHAHQRASVEVAQAGAARCSISLKQPGGGSKRGSEVDLWGLG